MPPGAEHAARRNQTSELVCRVNHENGTWYIPPTTTLACLPSRETLQRRPNAFDQVRTSYCIVSGQVSLHW